MVCAGQAMGAGALCMRVAQPAPSAPAEAGNPLYAATGRAKRQEGAAWPAKERYVQRQPGMQATVIGWAMSCTTAAAAQRWAMSCTTAAAACKHCRLTAATLSEAHILHLYPLYHFAHNVPGVRS